MRLRFLLVLLWMLFLPSEGGAREFVAYTGEVAPYTTTDADGVVSGVAVDVVEEVMKTVGAHFDRGRIHSISWPRSVEEVETTPGTMLFCAARTPQRESKFKWVGPIAQLNLGLVARRNSKIDIDSKEDVARYSLGVIRNSAPAQILQNEYNIDLKRLTLLASDTLQFRMLKAGRVDLIPQADTAASAWLKKLNMNQDDYEMVHVMKHLELYVAFNKSTDDRLIKQAQDALDAMKQSGRFDAIMQRYLEHGPIALQE